VYIGEYNFTSPITNGIAVCEYENKPYIVSRGKLHEFEDNDKVGKFDGEKKSAIIEQHVNHDSFLWGMLEEAVEKNNIINPDSLEKSIIDAGRVYNYDDVVDVICNMVNY
jgi:hypothetical protein